MVATYYTNPSFMVSSGVQSYDIETGTIVGRTITAGSTKVSVTYGSGVSGNPTIDISEGDLTLDNIGGTLAVTKGGTGLTSITDGGIMLGSGTSDVTVTAQPTDGQLLIGVTGSDPVLATLTAPAAGITITEGAGSITFALADDLAALEGLSSAGLVARTAANTYTERTITGTADQITVTNGDGVSGNPTISIDDDLFNWTLLETQSVTGNPASLDFTTGFDDDVYSEYMFRFSGIGGTVSSYPTFLLSNDGGSSFAMTVSYVKEINTAVSALNGGTSISVPTNNATGTSKGGALIIGPQSLSYRSVIRGVIRNGSSTATGTFWGCCLDTATINGIRIANAAGLLSGGSASLYGKR